MPNFFGYHSLAGKFPKLSECRLYPVGKFLDCLTATYFVLIRFRDCLYGAFLLLLSFRVCLNAAYFLPASFPYCHVEQSVGCEKLSQIYFMCIYLSVIPLYVY
jgi:hypothetical protein